MSEENQTENQTTNQPETESKPEPKYQETEIKAAPTKGDRFVRYARFQTPMHHPACGSFGDVLPSLTKTYAQLSMKESSYGLEVTIQGRTVVIPWANVTGYEASNEDPSPLNMREYQK